MIYVDSSVVLATLGNEARQPREQFWSLDLCASRLLVYECWNRLHARGLADQGAELLQELIDRIALVELAEPVLRAALAPFSTPLRTFDAIHLSTALFVAQHGRPLHLATYDERLRVAAQAVHLPTSGILGF